MIALIEYNARGIYIWIVYCWRYESWHPCDFSDLGLVNGIDWNGRGVWFDWMRQIENKRTIHDPVQCYCERTILVVFKQMMVDMRYVICSHMPRGSGSPSVT